MKCELHITDKLDSESLCGRVAPQQSRDPRRRPIQGNGNWFSPYVLATGAVFAAVREPHGIDRSRGIRLDADIVVVDGFELRFPVHGGRRSLAVKIAVVARAAILGGVECEPTYKVGQRELGHVCARKRRPCPKEVVPIPGNVTGACYYLVNCNLRQMAHNRL